MTAYIPWSGLLGIIVMWLIGAACYEAGRWVERQQMTEMLVNLAREHQADVEKRLG